VEKVYTIEIGCRNCGVTKNIEIPIGMTVRDFSRTKRCDKCGCHIDGSDQIKRHTKYTK
jgi:hypothetical protein